MAKTIYTARAKVKGGREQGEGRTHDGALEVALRQPPEAGGPGGGTNPEQLFAVGYAACFEGALGVVARRRKVDLGEVEIDSAVSLVADDGGRYTVSVAFDIALPNVSDPQEAREIVAEAHEVCPYSNATRGNIDVKLTANGQPVG